MSLIESDDWHKFDHLEVEQGYLCFLCVYQYYCEKQFQAFVDIK